MNLIVAVDLQWGFGKDGKIPWHCKEDFKFFKEKTINSVCVMGKNTHLDIAKLTNGKLLPGRKIVVITSDESLAEHVSVFTTVEKFVQEYNGYNVYFCGGERLYTECLKYVNNAYVTIIHGIYGCDKFFPSVQLMQDFHLKSASKPIFSESADKYIEFVHYERRK
jgi:dihydrofolate reductase